jgi:hypothetical protein
MILAIRCRVSPAIRPSSAVGTRRRSRTIPSAQARREADAMRSSASAACAAVEGALASCGGFGARAGASRVRARARAGFRRRDRDVGRGRQHRLGHLRPHQRCPRAGARASRPLRPQRLQMTFCRSGSGSLGCCRPRSVSKQRRNVETLLNGCRWLGLPHPVLPPQTSNSGAARLDAVHWPEGSTTSTS